MIKIAKNDIKGIECKHITYQKATDGSDNDLLTVKEVIHTNDGQLIPRMRFIENYERDIYITKKNHRNHNDKKEYEDVEKLDKYTCTQATMSKKIQLVLSEGRRFDPKKNLRDVCTNPYVYMADITTPTILKEKYRTKWPDLVSRNEAAILDIETDVLNTDERAGQPILISVTMGNKKILGLVKYYADRIMDVKETIHKKYAHYLSDVEIKNDKGGFDKHNLVEERGGDITILIDDKPGRLFARIMDEVHQWRPDFLAIWNMNFDVPKLNACLERENIPLDAVWCDPEVPRKYRSAWYKEAKAQRETNSKTISQHPADLWHVMFCQAGFYVIDAMCLFKKIRTANGNEPSYSLDAVLKRHLGIGKLKFDGVEGNGNLKWHIAMQKDYPVEYAIYNIFDTISIELLDAKTEDLSMTVSALADISELHIFPSLPKRLVDILTYFYKERGKIPASVGADITSFMDDDIISMTGWIVTLPAHMVYEDGLHCIEEIPELRTKFRVQTADDDLTQAYPTGGLVMNISKETTHIELCGIDGVPEINRRRAGINLTGGHTNAIEICNDIMGMPYIHDVLTEFNEQLSNGEIDELLVNSN